MIVLGINGNSAAVTDLRYEPNCLALKRWIWRIEPGRYDRLVVASRRRLSRGTSRALRAKEIPIHRITTANVERTLEEVGPPTENSLLIADRNRLPESLLVMMAYCGHRYKETGECVRLLESKCKLDELPEEVQLLIAANANLWLAWETLAFFKSYEELDVRLRKLCKVFLAVTGGPKRLSDLRAHANECEDIFATALANVAEEEREIREKSAG